MRGALAFLFMLIAATAGSAQQQNQAVPDAPALQKTDPLSNLKSEIMPGKEEQGADVINPRELNFVQVTVKDKQGELISGLSYRDFSLFENGRPQPLRLFNADPSPLSIVFVIDQNASADIIQMIRESAGAIENSLSKNDEAAFVLYDKGPDKIIDFTKATSFHFQTDSQISSEKVHTLNDAIFAAAKMLATRPDGRRRIIYVVGEGKEQGSKLSSREVVRYLQTNRVAVYATMMGKAASWTESYRRESSSTSSEDNRVLSQYVTQTGGSWDTVISDDGLERSYTHIAEEARKRYTLGYFTNEPLIDGKYRAIDVRVLRPNLNVIAVQGYYPPVPAVK